MVVSKIFSSVRYSLLTLNVIFLITGIAIFSLGISVKVSYNEYYHFLESRFFSLPAFLITTGVFVFLISAFGFFGVALQNYYLNLLYVGLMVLIFIFEVSICIAGYSLFNSTASIIQKTLLETLPEYGKPGNLALTTMWDDMQRDMQCCGAQNAEDWPKFVPQPDPPENEQTDHVPLSCCTLEPGAIFSFTCTTANAYKVGCAKMLSDWVSGHALSMGVAGLIICLIQLFAAVGAGWVAKRSKFEDLN